MVQRCRRKEKGRRARGARSAAFKSAGTLWGGGGVGPCARYGLEVRRFGSSASGPATTRLHVGVFVPAGSRTPDANKHRSHRGGMREHLHSRSGASQKRERCLLTRRPRSLRRSPATRSRSACSPTFPMPTRPRFDLGRGGARIAAPQQRAMDLRHRRDRQRHRPHRGETFLGRSRSRLNPIATIRGENAFRPMAKGGCPALDEEVRTPRLTQIPAPAPVRYLPPAVVRRG